jgi:hypothetical protein
MKDDGRRDLVEPGRRQSRQNPLRKKKKKRIRKIQTSQRSGRALTKSFSHGRRLAVQPSGQNRTSEKSAESGLKTRSAKPSNRPMKR